MASPPEHNVAEPPAHSTPSRAPQPSPPLPLPVDEPRAPSSFDDAMNPTDGADERNADLPLPMAASVILDALPRDAHRALENAGELRDANGEVRKKVKIRLTPLANTPSLRQPVFMCSASQRFSFIVAFVRSRLKIPAHEGVHCYINSVFAPALDEGVGGLWRCFKTGDELVVSYSLAQAFG